MHALLARVAVGRVQMQAEVCKRQGQQRTHQTRLSAPIVPMQAVALSMNTTTSASRCRVYHRRRQAISTAIATANRLCDRCRKARPACWSGSWE